MFLIIFPKKKSMKRVFCAIEVPASKEIRAAVDSLKQSLAGETIKWVSPNNYHLTLKFFGSIEESNVPKIVEKLKNCALKVLPFSFNVEGCGFFGKKNSPSVIWLGIKNQKGLVDLYKEVNKAILPLGYLPEKQFFEPHLTIGRFKFTKKPLDTEHFEASLANKDLARVEVGSFCLIESILHPHGPSYNVIEKFYLKNCSYI